MHWLNTPLLAQTTSRVVRRDDVARLHSAQAVLDEMRSAAAQQQAVLDAARLDASQQGYAAGLAQGRDDWARQLAGRHLTAQAQLLALQPTLLAVVMGALRHLLGALPDEQRFERLAAPVLQSLLQARQMRLVVAADDEAAARRVLHHWQQTHPDLLAVAVVVDDALAPGDCVLETDEGAVDGRLEQRLAAIEQALAQHLASVATADGQPTRPASDHRLTP